MFTEFVHSVAKAGTCQRLQVGAIIIMQNRLLSSGYNGAPRGLKHCTEVGCDLEETKAGRQHCKRAIHAEANAIINAAYNGVSTHGASMYVTHSPCNDCMKMIINAGIRKIYYSQVYPDPRSNDLMKEAGVEGIYVPFPVS